MNNLEKINHITAKLNKDNYKRHWSNPMKKRILFSGLNCVILQLELVTIIYMNHENTFYKI